MVIFVEKKCNVGNTRPRGTKYGRVLPTLLKEFKCYIEGKNRMQMINLKKCVGNTPPICVRRGRVLPTLLPYACDTTLSPMAVRPINRGARGLVDQNFTYTFIKVCLYFFIFGLILKDIIYFYIYVYSKKRSSVVVEVLGVRGLFGTCR